MARLRETPDDLFALVGRTAEAMGLPTEFVEKDFWITELLRSVALPVANALVVFKGGTSLSKGYDLIRRFSEDVDILLVPTAPGGKTPGKGSVDRILKLLCTRAQADLGVSQADAVLESSSTGVHRNVRYGYPARSRASAVKPGVLLEMGIRGGPEPREARVLRSLVGRHAMEQLGEKESAFDEFAPVKIEVLAPRLIDACEPALRPLVVAGLYTGARLGELIRLTWGDLTFGTGGGTGTISLFRPKVGNASRIPIHPRLAEELLGVREARARKRRRPVPDDEPIFLSSYGRAWVTIGGAFKKALKAAGLEGRGIVYHSLRHTFAVHFLEGGAAVTDLQGILGHADLTTTQIYAHMVDTRARASLVAMDYGATAPAGVGADPSPAR